MATLTWNGFWPMPDTGFPAVAVYTPVTPRQAFPNSSAVNNWLYASGGSGTGGTTFPVIPQFTKYPVAP